MKKSTILSLALVVVVMASSYVAWAATSDWVQVPSCTPDPDFVGRKPLTAISMLNPDYGHAVGYYNDGLTGNHWQTQAQRYKDGWKCSPTYNVPDTHNFLNGVATVSESDAWAVGMYVVPSTTLTSLLIERYVNGSWVNWAPPILPQPASDAILTSVVANAANDVWAVGSYKPLSGGPRQTLIAHWDGNIWLTVPSPNAGSGDNKLFGITSVPGYPYLLWAVGAYYKAPGDLRTLILFGDARRDSLNMWSVVPSYDAPGVPSCLRSVSAFNPDAVWAVGFTNTSCFDDEAQVDEPTGGATALTLVERWQDNAWHKENSPNPVPGGFNTLFGVSVASDSRVWAAGFYPAANGNGWQTMVLGGDFNGEWHRHCSKNPSGNNTWDRLLAVDGVSATSAWAAGWYYPAPVPPTPQADKPTLIETYEPPDQICDP